MNISLNTIKLTYKKNIHPFHLVNQSTWPFLVAIMLFNCVLSLVHYINFFSTVGLKLSIPLIAPISIHLFYINLIIFILVLCRWFRDIIVEATYEGNHTMAVQHGIYSGMVLFIISEIMFFFSFFWAFFHNALSPSVFIGNIWPPIYFSEVDALGIPLLNTMLLLMSGVTITYSHQSVFSRNLYLAIDGLIWTLIFGLVFMCLQIYEYRYSLFSINDGIYGSIFFILTGFHGLHVIIGCCFLFVSLYRLCNYHFSCNHHVGYEISILYWHMVDVVWLFLFIFLYLWGGSYF